ncbi:uncharacterized protein [Antennarius striatus]|uniref:uncharacterized protein isoform X2 n=1 Tax=Antennarius striatus TaxID=241820 RepID=UPI0035B423AC
MWTFPSSSPPIMHHFPQSQGSAFLSSSAPLSVTPSHPHVNPPPAVEILSSPQLLYQDASPHGFPWSPPFFPQTQAMTPHLPPFQQPHVTSPDIAAPSQMTSSPLLSPSQYHVYSQSKSPESSCVYQTTSNLEVQNQFSTGVDHHKDGQENTQRLPYNPHTLFPCDMYDNCNPPGPEQNPWKPLGPIQSHLPCLTQGFMSGEATLGRWSSVEEDPPSTQLVQPFCGSNTSSPGPYHPQTPTLSSGGGPPSQSTTLLYRDQTLSCLQEYPPYPLVTHQPHQRNQLHLQDQAEPIQDQTSLLREAAVNPGRCFSPQGGGPGLSCSVQFPSVTSGPSWKEGCGRERGRGRGENHQPDWTWMKQQHPKTDTEVQDRRLVCSVCNKEFWSVPALNGHMRLHSVKRSVTSTKKGADPVISVSVPIQSRVLPQVCRWGRRGRHHPPPEAGFPALYHSLLHLDGEVTVIGSRANDSKSGGVTVIGGHYIPPPMLCPLRPGAGLYCSLTNRGHQRAQQSRLHNTLDDPVATETAALHPGTLRTNKPWINIGWGFQAEIPPLRDQIWALSDSHNALLLWTPWDRQSPDIQHRADGGEAAVGSPHLQQYLFQFIPAFTLIYTNLYLVVVILNQAIVTHLYYMTCCRCQVESRREEVVG